ncbi:MAG: dienelactone hydrolase family protein [Pseudomonadales bacterium]|nr:dienelactone hydrolase family protein [Pseudomonadales bacterium]
MNLAHRLLTSLLLLVLLLPAEALANEQIVTLHDGSQVKVFLFYPKDHGEGPWPLCVLISGGVANEYIARAQFWLGHELANQGWAIGVPVSPDDKAFFGDNARAIPQVITELQKNQQISPGKSLLVGVSNGGSSAIEIAARDPEQFLGVVAVPGILKNPDVLQDMKQLPMFIRIGEQDFLRWHQQLPALREQLIKAGAKVDAALVPGANHVFPLNWDELTPWLDSLTK